MDAKKGLELLREPFSDNQINQKPQGTKAQNECPASEKKNCKICGGWHHPLIKHLSYVGHAALTDRLLNSDPGWNWEPLALTEHGLPLFDASGGLWIKLTVCGVTRLGYGNAQLSANKEIGSREKEVIGDALRNAAMRFGAALDLWHKGDLHQDQDPKQAPPKETEDDDEKNDHKYWVREISSQTEIASLRALVHQFPAHLKSELIKLAKEKSESLLPTKEAA